MVSFEPSSSLACCLVSCCCCCHRGSMWQGTATDETIGLRCVCVCVAAEAESVLLDRKADVRACVGVCVSNKDESDPVTQLARILHYTHHFATPHTRLICPIWLLRLGPFGPDEASSLISWVTSFSDTTTSVHCVAPAARVSF